MTIDYPDLINGMFELGGAFSTMLNVRQLWRDKIIAGVHWLPTLYFFTWGLWNIFYYPSLNQWASFVGGVAIAIVNGVWLISLLYFNRRRNWRL